LIDNSGFAWHFTLDILRKNIKAGNASFSMTSSRCFELVRFYEKHINALEDRPNGQGGDSELKKNLETLKD